MEQSMRFETQAPSGHVTVWGTLKALAVGTLIGASGILCSRWLGDFPLLCTAFRSTLMMVTLTTLTLAKPQDLVFECELADLAKNGNAQRFRGEYEGCPLEESSFLYRVDSAGLLRYPKDRSH